MDVKDKLREFVRTAFYIGPGIEVNDDTSLFQVGILDSTSVLELVAFLEDNFSIAVEDTEMTPANLDSITHAAEFVARKTGK